MWARIHKAPFRLVRMALYAGYMFVGHTAIALAAKRRTSSTNLGWFLAASFALDLVWPVFLLLDIERVRIAPGAYAFGPLLFESYPWSHSLAMACVWGALFFALARWRRIQLGTALLLGAIVVSHWVLDFIVHVPDLTLVPGSSLRLGLGLWHSIPGTFMIEGSLYLLAIVYYVRGSRARNWIGSWALWSWLLVSAALWASGPWGTPPPSQNVLGWVGLGAWLFILWGARADANRDTVLNPRRVPISEAG